MKASVTIANSFHCWIDAVASAALKLLGRVALPRIIKLVENAGGEFELHADDQITHAGSITERFRFVNDQNVNAIPPSVATILSGSRVELIMRPDQFVFRPLTLPTRATEFLDGIVRAQIDRLTPWTAANAAFGWSKPAEAEHDRILITVAATARQFLTPYVQAISDVGARSVAVFTSLSEGGFSGAPIKVFEENARRVLDIARIRRALVGILSATGIAAGAALGACAVIGALLEARQSELASQIASLRAASGDTASGSAMAARRMIERRKHDASPRVIVLETLSQILPDHTFLSELRIEGTKLRLIGTTRNAPSLIGLIEQSGRFARATFFAPTTRSSSDLSERFHIEAHIQPLGSPRT